MTRHRMFDHWIPWYVWRNNYRHSDGKWRSGFHAYFRRIWGHA